MSHPSDSGSDPDDPGPSTEPESEIPSEAKRGGGGRARSSVDVEVSSAVESAIDVESVRARLLAVLALVETPARLVVRIVDDREMIRLHARHLGVPGTTDVLSFDLGDGAGMVEAEVAVCADEARRQARRRGHAVERELLLYAVHGLLHCLGHDDRDEQRFRAMHAEEDRLLAAIGVGPTFSAGTEGER